jgi:hypothetical protein
MKQAAQLLLRFWNAIASVLIFSDRRDAAAQALAAQFETVQGSQTATTPSLTVARKKRTPSLPF